MKGKRLVAAAAVAVACVGCGGGNVDTANRDQVVGTAGDGGIVAGDRATTGRDDVVEFVRDAASHGTAEVELSRIAGQRGVNAQVKQFADMMVREHTQANEALMKAAGGQLSVQPQMTDDQRELAARLGGLQGAEFDREYMEAMVDGHETMKDLLQGRVDEIGDEAQNNRTGGGTALETDVNQWAARTLPNVSQHLERAQQLRDQLNARGTN